MLKAAVHHRANDSDCYPYDAETMHIKIRTMKDDVQHVRLQYGDPFNYTGSNWSGSFADMHKTGSDDLFDYWFIALAMKDFHRLCYAFELHSGGKVWYLTEQGFYSEEDMDTNHMFKYPYLHINQVFQAPEWVKNTVWYQIFPDRFANGNPRNDGEHPSPWSAEPTPTSVFGGDFEGIIQHLNHLVELGITGIYLTPIFMAWSNHKYDTIDYFEIDPHFGDKEIFRKFVDACHERGIRVMLDAVFNHSGFWFAPFQDVLKHGVDSKYASWFHIDSFPVVTGKTPNYETFAFTDQMPKLNTQNPEMKAYLLRVAKYWVEEFHIDGWRLDVANEVDHDFWRDFRTTVKSVNPDVYIVGEIWHDSMPWLRGDQFDSVMNYPLSSVVIDYAATGQIDAHEAANRLVKLLYQYPETVHQAMFNILSTHDTPRILARCGENRDKFKLAYLFLLSCTGAPCIYYGDEVGITSNKDNSDGDASYRRPMIWKKAKQDKELLAFMQQLIRLRKGLRTMRAGSSLAVHAESTTQNVLTLQRNLGTEQLYVVLNNSETAADVLLPTTGRKVSNVWTGHDLPSTAKGTNIHVPAMGFALVQSVAHKQGAAAGAVGNRVRR